MGLYSKLLSSLGIRHAFLPPNALLPDNIIKCRQIHSDRILAVDGLNDIDKEKADGLITEREKPIGIVTADCLPVLIADERGKCVAAIHAGWRGLKLKILCTAINRLECNGLNVQQLIIAIGPAIQHCCYEVGIEVIEELHSILGYLWEGMAQPWTIEQPKSYLSSRTTASAQKDGIWLDLRALANKQL